MSAMIFLLPVVPRPNLADPSWCEQYERECAARCGAVLTPPPRTRPLLVVSNDRKPLHNLFMHVSGQFDIAMAELRGTIIDSEGGRQ